MKLFQNLIFPQQFEKYNEISQDFIIIPKNKIFVSRTEKLNVNYLPKYDFPTANLLYINEFSKGELETAIKHKSIHQYLDVDLENSDLKVTIKFLDDCFNNQTRYLTFINKFLDDSVFDYFLEWLKKDTVLEYIELRGLNIVRLEALLENLKGRPSLGSLVCFFDKEFIITGGLYTEETNSMLNCV